MSKPKERVYKETLAEAAFRGVATLGISPAIGIVRTAVADLRKALKASKRAKAERQ